MLCFKYDKAQVFIYYDHIVLVYRFHPSARSKSLGGGGVKQKINEPLHLANIPNFLGGE